MATKQQSELLKAVINDNVKYARALLVQGVKPNFVAVGGVTLMREAIRNNSIKMVRLLVQFGADVNLAPKNSPLPLDFAEDTAAVTHDFQIVNFLKSKKAVTYDELDDEGFPSWMSMANEEDRAALRRSRMKVVTGDDSADPPKKKEPAFTAEKLKDIFNPEAWVGKLSEMDKMWDKVPQRLKKNFDFASKRAEATRKTIKKGPKGPKMPPC